MASNKVKITKSTPSTMFYVFRQTNSHGRNLYDANRGITKYVYIEATNEREANKRAEKIGIYFDGSENYGPDCSCCGDRWNRASMYDTMPSSDVPKKDEVLIRDDNERDTFLSDKNMGKDEYDAFIHPLDGDFYGAYKEFKHIKRRTAGYGFMFSENDYGDIYAVGKDGWSKDGNRSAPSPDYKYLDDDELLVDEPDRRMTFNDYGTYTLWTRKKADAEAVRARVKAFVDALPKMDIDAMLG